MSRAPGASGGSARAGEQQGAGQRVLVTGGGGFLGRAIVEQLLAAGYAVRSFARGAYPELEQLGAEVVRGDLGDSEAVTDACAGCSVAVHTAAVIPNAARSREVFDRVNVTGTEHVIAACRAQGVRRLVFTSSPSVVFSGEDLHGVDESVLYPDHYDSHYAATKALAEQAVLAANGPQLATVSLRPHLVWGPGDPHLVPQLVARARSGRLVRIGRGPFRIDVTYIDNAAAAHLQAAQRLQVDASCAGRAYFISQGEPVDLWEFVGTVLQLAGAPPVTRRVPRWLALAAAGAIETAYAVAGARSAPPISRFLIEEISSSHWFDISGARRDLGYEPRVSTAEGLRRLAAWYEQQGTGDGQAPRPTAG